MGKQISFAHVNAHGSFPAILGHHNLEFTQHGSQIRLRCPFHEDNTPSLSITTEGTDQAKANTFHCFGCGEKGSLIDFEAKLSGSDLRTAAETVARVSGCSLTPPRTSPQKRRRSPQKAPNRATRPSGSSEPEKRSEERSGASERVSGRNQPLNFELKLDLGHDAVLHRLDQIDAEHFGVGVASRGGMAGRICIPIHNADGQLVAYAGRWADAEVPQGEDKYRFPKGFNKSRELFNLHRLKNARHIVIVEGFFGAMRLHQLGAPVVALMGTSMSEAQVTLLKQAGVKSALVLLDGDEAGRAGGEAVGKLLARNLYVRVVHLFEGTAPDELDVETLSAFLPFPLKNRF